MVQRLTSDDVMEGLQKDAESGHYRVQPGYGHQAHRYRIDETWLDEEDGLWIDGSAVEREMQKSSDNQSDLPEAIM